MRVIFLMTLLLGTCLALPAQAAGNWLQRLAQAERQNFQGTFVYERNGSFSTHGIWHRGGADGIAERLLQLDGPLQEALTVNGKPQCMSGVLAGQAVDVQWPARDLDAEQLARLYELRVTGHSRVAGRSATILAMVPRDRHRYAFELHLDDETALPLKSLMISDKGQLLERFQFVSLQLVDKLDAAALVPGDECQPVKFDQVASLKENWKAGWVPPGFVLDQTLQRRSPASSDPVACLLYGDGLARFTIFLEPLHGERVEDSRRQLGPTSVVSKHMSTTDGDLMVTVVGEIPLGTAERVAMSMQTVATLESTAQ